MKRNYHSISTTELNAIFGALKNNSKVEQYDLEVKKSGNSIDLGQICGMLNGEGGIVIIGIEEKNPRGSGYNFLPISNVQDENGKIKTQIINLKEYNSEVARLIDIACIFDPFLYEEGNYIVLKINSSNAGFVFDGRFYDKKAESKNYLKTRQEILEFIEKTKDFESFVASVSLFEKKLTSLRHHIHANRYKTNNIKQENQFNHLESSEIKVVIDLLLSKRIYLARVPCFDKLVENLKTLSNFIGYIEDNATESHSPGKKIKFTFLMASMLDSFAHHSTIDLLPFLDETTNCLKSICNG